MQFTILQYRMANSGIKSETTVPKYCRCGTFSFLVNCIVCSFCADLHMSITVTSVTMAIVTLVDDKWDTLILASRTLDPKNIELKTDWSLLN